MCINQPPLLIFIKVALSYSLTIFLFNLFLTLPSFSVLLYTLYAFCLNLLRIFISLIIAKNLNNLAGLKLEPTLNLLFSTLDLMLLTIAMVITPLSCVVLAEI
jgi:hypothetical protein